MRREFSAKTKAEAVMRSGGYCDGCGRKLLDTKDFNFDHIIPDAIAGDESAHIVNCAVLCKSCHGLKTATEDMPRIAKTKRNFRTAHGIKKDRSIRSWRKFDGRPVRADRSR